MIRITMLLVALATVACSGNSATGPGPNGPVDDLDPNDGGDEFTLAIGERAVVPEAALAVTFTEVVGDSRCPVDVTCVWQGDGQVAIEVVQAAREIEVTLHTGVEPMGFQLGDWLVRLIGLAPDRREGEPIPPDAYRATFRVTRLDE